MPEEALTYADFEMRDMLGAALGFRSNVLGSVIGFRSEDIGAALDFTEVGDGESADQLAA